MSAGSPRASEGICAALVALHDESAQYWNSIGTAQFLSPINGAWSPADNVRHLTKSMRAVAVGLRVHWLVLRLRYGTAEGHSRSYEQIRIAYRRALLTGQGAGAFTPEPLAPTDDPEAARARIMGFHRTAVDELCAATMRWDNESLDKLRLPHPLLGKLTLREMLLFTLYHNAHHVENVKNRRGVILVP